MTNASLGLTLNPKIPTMINAVGQLLEELVWNDPKLEDVNWMTYNVGQDPSFMYVCKHESEYNDSSNLYGSIASWATNLFVDGQQRQPLDVHLGYFNVSSSQVEHKEFQVGWKSHNDENGGAKLDDT